MALLGITRMPPAPWDYGRVIATWIRELRWCTEIRGLDRPIVDAVEELELDPPFGIIDDETAIRHHNGNHDDATDLIALLEAPDPAVRTGALESLSTVVDRHPSSGLDGVPSLAAMLETGDVPADPILACLAPIAEAHPCQVTPVISAVRTYLEATDEVSADALAVVTSIAEHHPGAVRDTVPTLVTVLEDGECISEILRTVVQIAEVAPEAVLPACDTLDAVRRRDGPRGCSRLRPWVLWPRSSRSWQPTTVETAIDFLEADDPRLRANAAGLLADVADTAPDEVLSAVPGGDRSARGRGPVRQVQRLVDPVTGRETIPRGSRVRGRAPHPVSRGRLPEHPLERLLGPGLPGSHRGAVGPPSARGSRSPRGGAIGRPVGHLQSR
ncbi:MAG: hypothetical protein U5K37_12800 [Natrialbaceae archaeon]|nr:hypothetical protein [Natrialbaceae archaeon]